MTGEIFPIVWKCLFNLFRLVERGSLEAPLVGRNYSSNGLLSRNVSTFVERHAEMTKSSVCTRHRETWKNCRLVILSLHLPKPSICFLVEHCCDLLEKDCTPNERVILNTIFIVFNFQCFRSFTLCRHYLNSPLRNEIN